MYDHPGCVFTGLAAGRSSGGRDAGGCAIQDELDLDPHLVFAVQAVGADEQVPEPRVRAALHNFLEKGSMEELTSSSVTRNRDLVRASAAALLAAASRTAPC
jgi:hypothetical protein